ncbi:hypothetical protein, partial [Pseudomonas sp. PS01270]|uniref:hypothetical protein n=1 Tax=Pseudomonas sp. PS01270 TaxID=2991431 RepID=UPI00249A880C
AAPPSAVYDCVVRSLRSHARINPSTQPSDVACESRSKAVLELALIVLSGEGRVVSGCFCGEFSPHPSPLPEERELICVLFKS